MLAARAVWDNQECCQAPLTLTGSSHLREGAQSQQLRAEAHVVGVLTGSWTSPGYPARAEPGDRSQPLVVIIPIFVLKSKPKLIFLVL